MSENSAEHPPNSEKAKLQQTLQNAAKEVLLLNETNSNAKEYEDKMLGLMSQLEGAKEKLGDFCVTVGEGEDRAVVLRNEEPREKVTSIYGSDLNKDWGPIKTVYTERVIVNKTGIYGLANVQDQDTDFDIDQKLNDPNTPYQDREGLGILKKWLESIRPIVKFSWEKRNNLLEAILLSGKYMGEGDVIKRPISGSNERWDSSEQEKEWRRQVDMWEISQYNLSPRWKTAFGHGIFDGIKQDKYERVALRGFSTGQPFELYKITKSTSIDTAIQKSVR